MPFSRNVPFPAMLRNVSGRYTTMRASTIDERMKRKIKIDLGLSSVRYFGNIRTSYRKVVPKSKIGREDASENRSNGYTEVSN